MTTSQSFVILFLRNNSQNVFDHIVQRDSTNHIQAVSKKGDDVARRTSKTLTEVELEFMQILWRRGEATPDVMQEELVKKGRDITGGSIRKILAILMRKGYVDRRKESKAHVYRAVVGKQRAQRGIVGDILQRAFGGSAANMIAALLDSQPVPEEDLDAIEQLIAERRKGGKK